MLILSIIYVLESYQVHCWYFKNKFMFLGETELKNNKTQQPSPPLAYTESKSEFEVYVLHKVLYLNQEHKRNPSCDHRLTSLVPRPFN